MESGLAGRLAIALTVHDLLLQILRQSQAILQSIS